MEGADSAELLWVLPTLQELQVAVGAFEAMPLPDASMIRLRATTGPSVDLSHSAHRAALMSWLNAWGCRLAADPAGRVQFDSSVADWWEEWGRRLPTDVTLMRLSDNQIEVLADSCTALASARANSARTISWTAAAKTLHVVGPSTVLPWDGRIARTLHGGRNRDSFARHQRWGRRASNSIADEAKRMGTSISEIPGRLGRPDSTLAKLLDEYLYVTVTRA